MSFLQKQKEFVKFFLTTPSKKQAKGLLLTLTPGQNLVLREIILNISNLFPQKYPKLQKKVKKPLSKHFLSKHWEELWEFLKKHSNFILQSIHEEASLDTPRQVSTYVPPS